MATITEMDAHEQPTDELRAKWKSWAKMEPKEVRDHARIDDPRKPPQESGFLQAGVITKEQRRNAFSQFGQEYADEAKEDVPVLYHPLLPGLLIAPSLIPPAVQIVALETMLHRDLSNPKHQTNLHLHYDLPYPAGETAEQRSFFSIPPESDVRFTPKDPAVHKPLSVKQVFSRRLHWVTLGGQYDWTNRVYPEQEPPNFPLDLSQFLKAMFPDTVAQAAIVNFYSPGDTMMMHRDVSEFTDKGLVSLSFGCDGLFMIAPNGGGGGDGVGRDDGGEDARTLDEKVAAEEKEYLLLRLRSGDAMYMTQESRFAWHGVPKIVPDTCPEYLENWPAREDGQFSEWEGWMKGKRLNLNVRQVRD